jgi:hypothetical protein
VNDITFVMGAGRLNVYKDIFLRTIIGTTSCTSFALLRHLAQQKYQSFFGCWVLLVAEVSRKSR